MKNNNNLHRQFNNQQKFIKFFFISAATEEGKVYLLKLIYHRKQLRFASRLTFISISFLLYIILYFIFTLNITSTFECNPAIYRQENQQKRMGKKSG
jgi:hypothetical protein